MDGSIGVKVSYFYTGYFERFSDIDEGWVLEIAIPFRDLRTGYYQNNIPKDTFWRVNFSRVNWDFELDEKNTYHRKKGADGNYMPEYNWVWSPQGVISMHEPETWGYVYFSSKQVGKKEVFTIPNDEKIKWKLYKLYHAQKRHKEEHGKWATDIESLQPGFFKIDGKIIDFQMELHSVG